MANLTTLPRNAIGDRACPRYQLKTFRLSLRAAEPGAKVDSPSAAVPVLRQILTRLDADQTINSSAKSALPSLALRATG